MARPPVWAISGRVARWISAAEEEHLLHERVGATSPRARLLAVLQCRLVQLTLTVLLVLDVVVIFSELFLEAEFPHCRYVLRDAVSCCGADVYPASLSPGEVLDFTSDLTNGRRLGGPMSAAALCEQASPAQLACDDHKWDVPHALHEILFWVSISVLTSFEIELLLLILALGGLFFRNPLYLLDICIISSSLGLELFLHSLGPNKHAEEMAGLLVLSRLWRFLRIGHAIFSTSHMASEKEMAEMAAELRQLEHEYNIALEKAAAKA